MYELNNSTSLQLFILARAEDQVNEANLKLLLGYQNKDSEVQGLSIRQIWISQGFDSFVDNYLTTDFIGQYYQTTPSLSEQFGGNRKVDFVFEYTSKKIGDLKNFYKHENLLNSNGDLFLNIPYILVMKVKNKSSSWVDFRNAYIEPAIKANVQFTKDTQKGILKLELKSLKLKVSNLKIFKLIIIDKIDLFDLQNLLISC